MNENELDQAERQLEIVKRQDKLLAEIETRLHKMKEIAEYAAENQLSIVETNELNDQIEEQLKVIDELKELYNRGFLLN